MDLAPANTEPNNLLETRVEWHKEGETYDDVLTRNYEEWDKDKVQTGGTDKTPVKQKGEWQEKI